MSSSIESLPLRHLRVVELHAIGPVPFAGQILRSLGAQITRVSPLSDPGLGVPGAKKFDLLNQGKQPLLVDLKTPEGLTQVKQLLATSDVMLEGFRPGVLERLGLGPQAMAKEFPKLVIGRLSGWGEQGQLAPRAGHDINYLAMTGVLHAIGQKQQPVAPLNLVADFGGGAMHLLLGVMAKLIERSLDPQGKGGCATTSITAGTIGLTPMFYGMLASGSWNLQRENNILDGAAPFYSIYTCAEGKHVAVGAIEAKFFAELLDVLGLTDSIDPRKQHQRDYWPTMRKLLSERILTKTRDQWTELCLDRDACMSPVLDFKEASEHAHLQANHWFPSAQELSASADIFCAPRNTIQFT